MNIITLHCKGYVKLSYPVHISSNNEMSELATLLPQVKQYFIVIDEKILTLFPQILSGFDGRVTHVFAISANEHNKTLADLEKLFNSVFDQKPSRDDIVVAIGGGMVMNLGGLAASLIMRGLRFYYVPTTLTGQIDASMGSKQAVNFRGAKNWLGMINDPEFCYINTTFLATTSDREFYSQAVEGVKLCLATNKELFYSSIGDLRNIRLDQSKLRNFIVEMIQAKLAVVEKDLLEDNYGMSMLYGHTIGHAVEMLDHENINHGEGVGLGMLVAARISQLLGLASEDLTEIHLKALRQLELPEKIPKHIPIDAILEKLAHNKKNYGGETRFVLLNDVGKMVESNGNYFTVVPSAVVRTALEMSY